MEWEHPRIFSESKYARSITVYSAIFKANSDDDNEYDKLDRIATKCTNAKKKEEEEQPSEYCVLHFFTLSSSFILVVLNTR